MRHILKSEVISNGDGNFKTAIQISMCGKRRECYSDGDPFMPLVDAAERFISYKEPLCRDCINECMKADGEVAETEYDLELADSDEFPLWLLLVIWVVFAALSALAVAFFSGMLSGCSTAASPSLFPAGSAECRLLQ